MYLPRSGHSFDIVFLADLRFPGGTSTALASELRAATKAGLRVAIKAVRSTLLRQARPVHPKIMQAMTDAAIPLLGHDVQAHAQFLICHHPMLFDHCPPEPLGVSGEHVFLVLHHPPFNGTGGQDYDVTKVCDTLALLVGKRPVLAPVGPTVRAQLAQTAAEALPEDWHNLIDPEEWPDLSQRPHNGGPLRIGRHSRPHAAKWPDDPARANRVYPDLSWLEISMLGAEPDQLMRRYKNVPAHWSLVPFSPDAVQPYLAEIDLWVYFHGSEWIEAFGRAILEAAISGLTVVVPRHFEPLFGPACLYAEIDELHDIYAELHQDRRRLRVQGAIARTTTLARFGLDQFETRLAKIDPAWHHRRKAHPRPVATSAPAACAALNTTGAKRVLFMCSNGVGLGHITRLLAIAETSVFSRQPVFFTMSRGVHFLREAGFGAEYMPFHKGVTRNNESWNRSLAARLDAFIDFHDVGTIVFDGNMPYGGLISVMQQRPELLSVWCRRGFWREDHAMALKRAHHFDLILQPDDIADMFDAGPTARAAPHVAAVPPVWRVPPGPVLDREAALSDLGLDLDQRFVLVALGSQSNFSFASLEPTIARHILHQGRTPVWLRSPLAPITPAADVEERTAKERETLDKQSVFLDAYPIQRHLAAFDYAVSAAGYNSFHELTAAALPTIWVPNEAGEMDQQGLRAAYANVSGLGLALRSRDIARSGRIFAMMDQPRLREEMVRTCRSVQMENGARAAALEIAALAAMSPTRLALRP